ncbi:MAG: hypothetical protein IJN96_02885 [Clostridia bacterium]|nr:hypothetical protein [Clostridia bacterium]
MTTSNCDCTLSCTVKSVIASIIIGVLAAIFRFTALITITPAFLWVLFGIAVGFLGISLLTSALRNFNAEDCCGSLTTFLTAILGTILTSVILLGITFAATSVIGAIITGLLLFFFSLLITSSVCLINCRSCGE